MRQTSLIKDPVIRKEIEDIYKRLDRIESIPQLPSDTTREKLIEWFNKVTNSIKRNR